MSCDFCDDDCSDFTSCQTCFSGVCFSCRSRCSECMETICPECDINEENDGICNSCLTKSGSEKDDDEQEEEQEDEEQEEEAVE